MKIAIIAKTRSPIAEPFDGGLEAFTFMLCKEYARLGHEVVLYAHQDSNAAGTLRSFYGADIRTDPYVDILEGDEYVSILKDIEQQQFDVIHNNSTHPLPIIWGAKAPVPMVTTLHTPPYSKLKAAASLASLSHNLHFIAVSQSLQKAWQPFIAGPLSFIYNGVDLNDWPLVRTSVDYLFWYGRIIENKGLDIALDAAHLLDMPLHFAGPVSEKAYFEEQVKPRIAAKDVYLGHINQSRISQAMHGAAAMVYAARWEEPFGLSTVEAMASGVPVAGFDRGAFRELITPASGVIAEGTNVAALANAIKAAAKLQSQDVHKEAARFPASKVAEKYIAYFEGIV